MLKTRVMFNLMRVSSRSMRTSSTSWNTAPQTAGAPEKLSIPVPEGADKPFNPKLDNIVSQIASLNLLEVSELSSLLKSKLNLPDTAMMPMGGFVAQAAAPAAGILQNSSHLTLNFINHDVKFQLKKKRLHHKKFRLHSK